MGKHLKTVLIVSVITLILFTGCGSATPQLETGGGSPVPLEETPSSEGGATSEVEKTEMATPTTELTEEPQATQEGEEQAQEIAPQPVEECSDNVCTYSGMFLLERPIGSQGRQTIDHTSRFGTYQKSSKDAMRGVFFLNSTGTPVTAAADGVVVVAGDDSQAPYGRYRNALGNLVILEHDLPGIPVPVYTLYGHLSEVSVQVDDQVEAGQEIGLVGMSGDISGSTLYFEVRYGENTYQSARNPELWLKPLEGDGGQTGALAGRILNEDGKYLTVPNIILEQLAGPGQPAVDQFYIRTYAGESLIGQDPWDENFALEGLPAGEYQVSFLMNGMRQQVVEVSPGEVTVVTFTIE
jgi:murein DD-endopeptidase MepM/ murein hydrolase activator NlpD